MDVSLSWVMIIHVKCKGLVQFVSRCLKLKEVRYVPQVKTNLTSVGTLEALGHGVSDRMVFLR